MMVMVKRTIGGAITQNCVQNGIVIPPIGTFDDYSQNPHKTQQKKCGSRDFISLRLIFFRIYFGKFARVHLDWNLVIFLSLANKMI